MIYQKNKISEINDIQLDILQNVLSAINKLSLSSFLVRGSLLGTVKESSFMLYDDYIDIATSRESYDILANKTQNFLSVGYYLQTPYNDKKTPYYYSKLRINNTEMVEMFYKKLKINHGIYVDIYPIDNVPSDQNEYTKMHTKYKKSIRLFVFRQCPYSYSTKKCIGTFIKNILHRIISIIPKTLPMSFYVKKLDKISKKYNNHQTDSYGNYSFSTPLNSFKKNYPLETGLFCGINVNIPNDWKGNLERRYGDYLSLPLEDKRVVHRPDVLNFGPYCEGTK